MEYYNKALTEDNNKNTRNALRESALRERRGGSGDTAIHGHRMRRAHQLKALLLFPG